MLAQTTPLLERTQQQLGVRRWHLRFPPDLEARFEADTGPKRQWDLVVTGLISLLIYDLFLFNDALIRPELMSEALLVRLGVMTPYGLGVLWLIHRGLPPALREGLMASTVVLAIALSSGLFYLSTSPHAMFDPFVFSLIFVAANVVYPLRFVHAVVTSAANLVIATAFLVAYPAMPLEAKTFAFALLLGSAVFTLLANYRLEASDRRSYLLLLRETLRSEAAQRSNQALTVISNTDALTQLANRRWFDQMYATAWTEAAAAQQPLAVLTIDVDNFKRFNDRFGHPEGDRCLRTVADAMRRQLRGGDFIARVGGEEFVVVLRNADAGIAAGAAERIRHAVEALAIAHDGQAGQHVVTVSIGVAVVRASQGPATEALRQSDRALYRAKRGGRNRVHGLADDVVAGAGAAAQDPA